MKNFGIVYLVFAGLVVANVAPKSLTSPMATTSRSLPAPMHVVLAFLREATDPKDAATKYTTTRFDMFLIEDGKIGEHWDAATKK